MCMKAWPPLPFPYLSPIALSYHSTHYPSTASCDCVKSLGLYFPRHRDKERKSESRCLWQYQGERAQWCLGDSVVIGTKQIKCQPFKIWLGSRGSGQANSFRKQSTAIPFLSLSSCLDFLDTDGHFRKFSCSGTEVKGYITCWNTQYITCQKVDTEK